MKFLTKQTPDTDAAIAALQRIFDKKGLRTASRTYAEALCERLERSWMQKGVKRSRSRCCVHKLLGKRCTHIDCIPPHTDHCSMWLKNGKPIYLVSQPYNLSYESTEAINAYCAEHDLTYRILATESFYFPSSSILVCFWAKTATAL